MAKRDLGNLKCFRCKSENIEPCLDTDIIEKDNEIYVQVPFCCRKCGQKFLVLLKEIEKIEILE